MKKYRLKKSIKNKIKNTFVGLFVAIALIAKLGCLLFQEDGQFIQQYGYRPVLEIYIITDALLVMAMALSVNLEEMYDD